MFKWARRRYLADVFGRGNSCTGNCNQGRSCTCKPDLEKEMKGLTDFERGFQQGRLSREWKSLTTEEIHKCVVATGIHVFEGDIYKFVQMLEDILQEKNG